MSFDNHRTVAESKLTPEINKELDNLINEYEKKADTLTKEMFKGFLAVHDKTCITPKKDKISCAIHFVRNLQPEISQLFKIAAGLQAESVISEIYMRTVQDSSGHSSE